MKVISLFSGAGGLDLGFKKLVFQYLLRMNLIKQFGKLLN